MVFQPLSKWSIQSCYHSQTGLPIQLIFGIEGKWLAHIVSCRNITTCSTVVAVRLSTPTANVWQMNNWVAIRPDLRTEDPPEPPCVAPRTSPTNLPIGAHICSLLILLPSFKLSSPQSSHCKWSCSVELLNYSQPSRMPKSCVWRKCDGFIPTKHRLYKTTFICVDCQKKLFSNSNTFSCVCVLLICWKAPQVAKAVASDQKQTKLQTSTQTNQSNLNKPTLKLIGSWCIVPQKWQSDHWDQLMRHCKTLQHHQPRHLFQGKGATTIHVKPSTDGAKKRSKVKPTRALSTWSFNCTRNCNVSWLGCCWVHNSPTGSAKTKKREDCEVVHNGKDKIQTWWRTVCWRLRLSCTLRCVLGLWLWLGSEKPFVLLSGLCLACRLTCCLWWCVWLIVWLIVWLQFDWLFDLQFVCLIACSLIADCLIAVWLIVWLQLFDCSCSLTDCLTCSLSQCCLWRIFGLMLVKQFLKLLEFHKIEQWPK